MIIITYFIHEPTIAFVSILMTPLGRLRSDGHTLCCMCRAGRVMSVVIKPRAMIITSTVTQTFHDRLMGSSSTPRVHSPRVVQPVRDITFSCLTISNSFWNLRMGRGQGQGHAELLTPSLTRTHTWRLEHQKLYARC